MLDGPATAVGWPRRGITHFLQPHTFAPRGVRELRLAFGDVYAELLAAGADEVDCARKLPGDRIAADDELRYLAVRRPVIEWALRHALCRDGAAVIEAEEQAVGLVVDRGRVRGLRTTRGDLAADVVVDAMGRRSPMASWRREAGLPVPTTTRGDCGVIYYARYYRVRPGAELPDGPWYLSPRGDLGYAAYASFPGDAGTFAGLIAVPPPDRDLRVLRHDDAFDAAVALTPLDSWTTPDLAEPITSVMPMGSLHDALDTHQVAVPGLFPVGDAVAHTDPVMALGLSFSLVHARALAGVLRACDDDAAAAHLDAVLPEARERFEVACSLDEARLRMWTGGSFDLAHAAGDYALFTLMAAGGAATIDPAVFSVFLRRIGMLDRTGVLAAPTVPRDELLAAAFSAARG